MESELQELFTEEVLEAARRFYEIGEDGLTYIGGFQNVIYECRRDGVPHILRFTPSAHRSVQEVRGELEWIQYLAEHGVPVCRPVPSPCGRVTEGIRTAGEMYFTASVFEKAPGRPVRYPECLQDDGLYERLGRLTGRMHALSGGFRPADPATRRQEWTGNYYLRNLDRLPPSHYRVREEAARLFARLAELPRDGKVYGLIHGDMGIGNLFAEADGGLTVFDFDEAQYSWFAEDIAVQLYYLVYVYGGEEGRALREDQAERFMGAFLKGYRREFRLGEEWLRRLPLFLQLRELIVYIGAFRNFNGDESFGWSDNAWFRDWIAESRQRLESGTPIVDIWN